METKKKPKKITNPEKSLICFGLLWAIKDLEYLYTDTRLFHIKMMMDLRKFPGYKKNENKLIQLLRLLKKSEYISEHKDQYQVTYKGRKLYHETKKKFYKHYKNICKGKNDD